MTVYDYSAVTLEGKEVSLKDYAGKVLVIVNTASKCGFAPQLEQLQELYKEYQEKGLVILGFPSNQFMNQEPGSSKEIAAVCQRNYGVSFPMFEKVKVNGPDAHPLYKHLTSQASGLFTKSIKWNFTKFLVDAKGNVVERFAPKTSPLDMKPAIEKQLK
ncbi:glutathione peroxidase [Terribacillus halophilus]|uniref:Glutathione peroxidase n=1 Tax=Terribacillus halophilus TaxID=361279 RepID=A0A1G6RVS8_9BACI|nr:glutathione peroxidase [Terribacillus halophilus]SDD08057.1 glutathione peroxidase [Terribacillus halophilus]